MRCSILILSCCADEMNAKSNHFHVFRDKHPRDLVSNRITKGPGSQRGEKSTSAGAQLVLQGTIDIVTLLCRIPRNNPQISSFYHNDMSLSTPGEMSNCVAICHSRWTASTSTLRNSFHRNHLSPPARRNSKSPISLLSFYR